MPPRKRKQVSSKHDTKTDATESKAKSARDSLPAKKAKKEDNKTEIKYCHWLMKSEPESRIEKGVDVKFGIEDLKTEPDQTACWDGVRNYQARNMLRDDMKEGHEAFFYHSNCKEPGIAGIVKIVRSGYPDHTQFDKKDIHYDPASKKDDPRWYMVDVQYVRMLKRFVSLRELKAKHLQHRAQGSGPLAGMALFTRARLSVQPVTKDEWDYILSLEDQEEAE